MNVNRSFGFLSSESIELCDGISHFLPQGISNEKFHAKIVDSERIKPETQVVILFGFTGCGKTTLGKKLAALTHRCFIDTDELLQIEHRKTSRELYREGGEVQFRALETKILENLCFVNKAVIAVGGGTVLAPANVNLLQRIGLLIYLEVGEELVKERMFKKGIPAFFSCKSDFKEWFALRKPIYESIKAIRVNAEQNESSILSQLILLN